VRGEFARLARNEPRIDRDFVKFLGAAYQFRTIADYSTGSSATPISAQEASASIGMAGRFIDAISRILQPGA